MTEVVIADGKTIQHPVKAVWSNKGFHETCRWYWDYRWWRNETVFKAVGVENVLAKILGSSTAQNVAYATIKGLREMYKKTSLLVSVG